MIENKKQIDGERLEGLLWRFLALDEQAQERVLREVREADEKDRVPLLGEA